jgi:hypothetical protein
LIAAYLAQLALLGQQVAALQVRKALLALQVQLVQLALQATQAQQALKV